MLNGLAKRTQHFNIFKATCGCLCAPNAQPVNPPANNAHALVQQCCMNVAKQVQYHATRCTKKLNAFKFDPTSSNMSQNISIRWPNVYNICCAQQCWKMLRWNVASVWPGLKMKSIRCANTRSQNIRIFLLLRQVSQYSNFLPIFLLYFLNRISFVFQVLRT